MDEEEAPYEPRFALSLQSFCHSDFSSDFQVSYEFDESACNGPFIDFLQRKVLKVDNFEDSYKLIQKGLAGDIVDDWCCPEALEVIRYEALVASLSLELESSWSNDEVTSERTPLKLFIAHAKNIRKWDQQAKCLKAEITRWNLRRHLNKARKSVAASQTVLSIPDIKESEDERRDRLNEFWMAFHTSGNKKEGALSRSEIQLGRTGESFNPVCRNSKAKRGLLEGKAVSSKRELFEEKAARTRDVWKHRGALGLKPERLPKLLPELHESQSAFSLKTMHQTCGDRGWKKRREEGKACSLPGISTTNKWQQSLTRQAVSLPTLHSSRSPGMSQMSPSAETPTKDPYHELIGTKSRDLFSTKSRDLSSKDRSTHDDACRKTAQLPPIVAAQQFTRPWQDEKGKRTRKCDSPADDYLEACEQAWVVPVLMPFVTGHSAKLQAAYKSLGDADLLAVVGSMKKMTNIVEVDLTGNGLLTEKSVVPLLSKLFGKPASSTLNRLSLNRCLRQASRPGVQLTVDTMIQLLSQSDGVAQLRHLDMTGISLGIRSQFQMCQAIHQHPSLMSVCLADVGLNGSTAKQCIGELLQSPVLQYLDLGWNCFDKHIFRLLGDLIVEARTLVSLRVPNCTPSFKMGGDNPIQHLLEPLARDRSLTYLDISMNRIDFRGSLVLEDVFDTHRKLEELDISQNPLGVLGMRSVLRLLSVGTSGLMRFKCSDCATSIEDSPGAQNVQMFRMSNPGGRYVLDLSRPYHRTLLRMLYKTCVWLKLAPEIAFSDIVFSKDKYKHPSKDNAGLWDVRREGRLTFNFSIDHAMNANLQDVGDNDFTLFLQRHLAFMKLTPSFKKIIPLLAQWSSIQGHSQDELVMLDALSQDFELTYPEIRQLCTNRMMVSAILLRFIPGLIGNCGQLYLTMQLLPGMYDHLQLLKQQSSLFGFNTENPTGRYRLELSNPPDYECAERLLLLDRWEAIISRRRNRFDISQRGNKSCLRNEKHNDVSLFEFESLAQWDMPSFGFLEFDYASNRRLPTDAEPLQDECLTGILVELQRAKVHPMQQVKALRSMSDRVCFTSLQMRELLGIFREEEVRANVFVMFFLRVTDPYNEKAFRVRFESRAALDELRHRLGYVILFPFMQPEQTRFELDFSKHDHRIAGNMLLQLMAKERWENLKEPTFIRADGTVDALPLGVPKAWLSLSLMPESGVFKGMYICAPEDMKFQQRQMLLESYGFWKAPASPEDVLWWAVLTETPQDVLEYMEFLVGHYDDIWEPFTIIDGVDGNGQISLREFEAGIKKMKCKKFDGPNETARINAVFRYLDPSGEGQVSKDEWSILGKLFKEIKLSVKEFVQFCQRTFGQRLEDAWKAFDTDGGGEIDEEEWAKALSDCGYFGPSKPIFSFLDKDDEGTVSWQEFYVLREFADTMSPQSKRRSAQISAYQRPRHTPKSLH